jgi:thiol:disulfide interchange protein
VFVYFTADWCLSCKANEAGAIERAAVQAAFAKAGVITLVGDWTNGDPVITRTLADLGRNSVPLYLWYAPGAAQPDILPQILTPGMLTDKAAGR